MTRASRTYRCDVEKLVRLLNNSGWTLKQLADASGVNEKTISRMLQGEGKFRSIIALVAKALGVEPETLIHNPAPQSQLASRMQPLVYQLHFSCSGSMYSPEHATYLANVVPDLIAGLRTRGITVDLKQSELVLSDPTDDFGRRFVQLIGLLDEDVSREEFFEGQRNAKRSQKYGLHCRLFATIKPSKYESFLEAVASRRLSLSIRGFSEYGELIDIFDDGPFPELLAGRFTVPSIARYCHSVIATSQACTLPDGREISPGAIVPLKEMESYLHSLLSMADW